MPVTLLYAGLLSLVFLILSARVVLMRGEGGISLGDGGNPVMLRRIRAHANFAEYVPLLLLMIGFLEASGVSATVLHGLGATLLVARVLHGYALSFTASFKFGRMVGAALTFLLLLVAGVLCLYQAASI
ncbi:MAG: hypothetical protein K0R03_2297 [Moraxellaceae bacterium]|jgi:uncharacterized membrane protein YecN with MAPEG domain|nr:hypothetical protein [Moraxellaceae bacterium]